ncbi:MAG: hypothetical protein WDM79_07210 [Terricaulis sp.]
MDKALFRFESETARRCFVFLQRARRVRRAYVRRVRHGRANLKFDSSRLKSAQQAFGPLLFFVGLGGQAQRLAFCSADSFRALAFSSFKFRDLVRRSSSKHGKFINSRFRSGCARACVLKGDHMCAHGGLCVLQTRLRLGSLLLRACGPDANIHRLGIALRTSHLKHPL